MPKNTEKAQDRAREIIQSTPEPTPRKTSVATPKHDVGPVKPVLVNARKYHLLEMSPTRKVADKQRNIARDKTKTDLDRQISMLSAHIRLKLKDVARLVSQGKFDDAMRYASVAVTTRETLNLRLDAREKLNALPNLPERDPVLRKSRSFKKVKQYKRWSDNPKDRKS